MAINRNDRSDSDDGGANAATQQRRSSLPVKITRGYDFVGAREIAEAQSL